MAGDEPIAQVGHGRFGGDRNSDGGQHEFGGCQQFNGGQGAFGADRHFDGGRSESGGYPLAARLDFLFTTVRRPVTDKEQAAACRAAGDPDLPREWRSWSNAEFERALKDRNVSGCTRIYLGFLRAGQRDNPSLHVLQGIARIFEVPLAFLVEDVQPGRTLADHLAEWRRHRERSRAEALEALGPVEESLDVRLNRLFTVFRAENGHEYTDAEVAAAVGSTAEEIRSLRDGSAHDVGINVLRAVAGFFSVPARYLLGDPEDYRPLTTQLNTLATLVGVGPDVVALARALNDASPRTRRMVGEVVAALLREDALDDEDGGDEPR
ncbi:hypothetical protein V5P93_002419 [Actinokineospora auranticolor]|uniref:HTH cro/C1-type domain-containing protein n=1 Tax=Actinokineospora auranticolor TaxID=155976 RepID=A0A2S6GN44_9PSEU|nr:hypothetical protein [Actinokineospora auranticolor]PPK66551.1 hypothetical protein CLV40_110255 [Actinokineospora auranticolor]